MQTIEAQEPEFDLADSTLFGAEAAEAEPNTDVFLSYFYEKSEFVDFLEPSTPLLVANAYKGEGKSALLRAVEQRVKRDRLGMVVRYASADLDVPDQGESYDSWMRSWRRALIMSVAVEVGKAIKVAWTEDDILAVEEAERHGVRERNIVGLLLDRFTVKGKVGGAEIGPKAGSGVISDDSINRILSDKTVWLLIDEADVNFTNTTSGRYKVAGLLTACRKLCQTTPNMRVRTTVRPTTWTALYSKVEDMTHVRDRLHPLEWQTQDIRNILAKRIEGYLLRTGQLGETRSKSGDRLRDEELIQLLFSGTWKWARSTATDDGMRPAYVVLSNLCRDRPRWLIELCKEAARRARLREATTITKADVIGSLADFGRRRIQDLQGEFLAECGQIELLINGFVGQREAYKTDALLTTIKNRITNHADVRISYEPGRCSPMQVAHFLFRIGFLTARREFADGDYQHFSYAQQPSLLRDAANPDQGYSWEIHPIFRQALGIRDDSGLEVQRTTGESGKERR